MAYDKTKGLVLHQIKYGDTSLIVHYFTREHGRLAFMVKGARSRKSRFKSGLFQPLELHQLEISYKEKHNLQHLKEVSILHPELANEQNFSKLTIKLFLAEVLYRCLREELKNEELFDFIESALLLFSGLESYANFHLVFLLKLARFMGFQPGTSLQRGNEYFDLKEGVFAGKQPMHDYYVQADYSKMLSLLLSTDLAAPDEIKLSRHERAYLLDQILIFYRLHFEGFGQLRSLDVLKTVFD